MCSQEELTYSSVLCQDVRSYNIHSKNPLLPWRNFKKNSKLEPFICRDCMRENRIDP